MPLLPPPSPADCDHLRVDIKAIERPWCPKLKLRVVRGHCRDCTGDVRRAINSDEIKTGIPQTLWK